MKHRHHTHRVVARILQTGVLSGTAFFQTSVLLLSQYFSLALWVNTCPNPTSPQLGAKRMQLRTGRIAGALYLLSAVAAGMPLIYVSRKLLVPDDAAKTAANILASEASFRACIVSELIGAITFIFVVGALYLLLREVNKMQASLIVAFVLISVPITFLNVLNEVAALRLLHGDSFLGVVNGAQRDALALLVLNLHGDGASVANIFWGLWLFPFGALVIRSGFIPRILGVLLILNGIALVMVSLTALMLPTHLESLSRYAVIPELGELGMMGWLLIKDVRPLNLPDEV